MLKESAVEKVMLRIFDGTTVAKRRVSDNFQEQV